GLVLSQERFAKDIDKAVFPNAQGGPIMSQVAAKAVCFREAATPEFRAYTGQIVRNAKAMASRVQAEGVRVVSGGTDNHLFLVDLRSIDEDLTGKAAARLLDGVGITLNFNTIPNDPRPPYRASGLRIGTPAMTTQGMEEPEAEEVASLIARALHGKDHPTTLEEVRSRVADLAAKFPPYPSEFPGHV
ncbi:MAG: serine hydroxymethyltransferase, partial [Acidimicrobiia bacterium]